MDCKAFISLHVKHNNKDMRYRDTYIRVGLVAIIKVTFLHSHRINVAEAWNWLKRHPEIKEIFIRYFNNGMLCNNLQV
jgi:hypothetical protein